MDDYSFGGGGDASYGQHQECKQARQHRSNPLIY
jgi:hypothetical protein